MDRMSVAEIAKAVAAKHGLTQENAEAFVLGFFDVLNSGLHADKSVKVRGLGTFKIVDVRERESVNVNTGERVTIEGHGKISFTPDPIMRDLVNKPFAKFDTVVLNDGVELDELNNVGGLSTADYAEEDTDEEFTETDNTTQDSASEGLEKLGVQANNTVYGEEETRVDNDENVIETTETAENIMQEDPLDVVNQPILPADSDETEIVESIFNSRKEPFVENEEPSVVNDAEAAETENTEQEEAEDDDEIDESPTFFERNKTVLLFLGSLFIAVVSFVGGYILGQSMASRPVFKTVEIYDEPKNAVVADTVQTVDTVRNSVAQEEKTEPKTEVKSAEKPTENKKAEAESAEETKEETPHPETAALSTAKRQVKTGAYTIIGTAQTVTVKKGQTLKKLSKLYLGDGMECYIQVHNNVEDLSEGMKIKIPQLKLKKR